MKIPTPMRELQPLADSMRLARYRHQFAAICHARQAHFERLMGGLVAEDDQQDAQEDGMYDDAEES